MFIVAERSRLKEYIHTEVITSHKSPRIEHGQVMMSSLKSKSEARCGERELRRCTDTIAKSARLCKVPNIRDPLWLGLSVCLNHLVQLLSSQVSESILMKLSCYRTGTIASHSAFLQGERVD